MTDEATEQVSGEAVLVFGQEDDSIIYLVLDVDDEGQLIISPDGL